MGTTVVSSTLAPLEQCVPAVLGPGIGLGLSCSRVGWHNPVSETNPAEMRLHMDLAANRNRLGTVWSDGRQIDPRLWAQTGYNPPEKNRIQSPV